MNKIKNVKMNCHEEIIHDTTVLVKDIPDPISETLLDPRVYEWRKEAESEGNPLASFAEAPVELIRETPAYPSLDVSNGTVSVIEKTITTRHGEIPIYIMKPAGGSEIKPILIYYHGGAFIAGCTEVAEPFCKVVAEEADAIVIGVDYHLAPEHLFPVQPEDCYDAMEWIYKNAASFGGDAKRIGVCGDSAGATLALDVALMDKNQHVKYQALIYPAVLVDSPRLPDYKWRLSMYEIPDDDIPAMNAALSLKALTSQMAKLYMGVDGPVTDPIASPLLMEDISHLPYTFITLCEFDYLRLQGEAFSRRLEREGIEHRTILYRGMDHEYIDRMGYCPQAYDTATEIAADLKNRL